VIPTPRILIVDDDPRFLRVLHLALSSHGYEVTDAADGKEALDAVADGALDLIVLDCQMPGMDGLQTCRLLRLSSAAPVIMISGNRSNSHEVALNAGANDYLAKPFSIDELLTRIETSLKS
jgi:DNA-binding response OmpR family regulator